jgi:hypothetical protein
MTKNAPPQSARSQPEKFTSVGTVITLVKLLFAEYEEGCLFGIRPLYSQSPQEREY